VSRLLRDKAVCEKLRGCDTCENLLALITKRTGTLPN
jgi:mannitol/fructose-specific phosphotransferase system IIA component (Ntr-type)